MVWSTSVTSRPARQSPIRMAESPCANWTEQTGRLAVVAPRWRAERPSTLSIQSAMSKRGMLNRMDGRRTSHHSNRGPATFEGQTGPLDRLDCEVIERHRVPDSSPEIRGVTSRGVAPSSFLYRAPVSPVSLQKSPSFIFEETRGVSEDRQGQRRLMSALCA